MIKQEQYSWYKSITHSYMLSHTCTHMHKNVFMNIYFYLFYVYEFFVSLYVCTSYRFWE